MVTFGTIISPEELNERLGDPKLAIFDCRHALGDFAQGLQLYNESHIPGAFFAAVEEDLAGEKSGRNGRHPMPDPDDFARFLRAYGVHDDTQIVAYDGGGDMFAPRMWFLCRWIGHDNAAVVDGGFAAWTKLGYPVTKEPPKRAREGNLTVRLRPELLVDAAFVTQHLRSERMHLVDARARERYAGEVEPIDPVAGHIPGARNRWFKENFEESGRLKSKQRLREEFAQSGCDPGLTVHQCGSGVSAAVNYFAMTHAGLEGSRIYNGSWSEWVSDPTRPVEKSASA